MIAKIVRSDGTPPEDYLWFYCGGCSTHHAVPVTGPKAWGWNGNVDSPTLTPSIHVSWTFGDDRARKICHSFVRDGQIQYLGDCTHALAGQTVPLEELP